MKRILLTVIIILFTTGCVSIKKSDLDTLISSTVNSKYNLYNHVMRGYKYYLPRELTSTKIDNYNEILKSKYYDYYLYIDLVSYYNQIKHDFKVDNSIYYSKIIEHDDKSGIVNIKETDENRYLIKVIYNYAKIEVIVNKEDINEAFANIMVVLTSINYNDLVIKNIMGSNSLSSTEEIVDIFENKGSDDNYLDVTDEYEEEEEYDPDIIN